MCDVRRYHEPEMSYVPDNAEKQMVIDEVRRFVERKVMPVAHELEQSDSYPVALIDKLKEMGVFAATIPEEYGGLGFDFGTYVQIVGSLRVGGSA